MSEERFHQIRILEAVLFAVPEPMTEAALASHLPKKTDVASLLSELAQQYANRGINLVCRNDRWAFRTATDLAGQLKIEVPAIRKLSRAATETLAVVAYHQPVTRAEIEEIRGVALSKGTLDTLLELGWVKPKGRRETPGRPVMWVTTDAFFDHFGIEGQDALPGMEELRAAGLLETGSAVSILGSEAAAGLEGEGGGEEAQDESDRLDEEALVAGLDLAEDEVPDQGAGSSAA